MTAWDTTKLRPLAADDIVLRAIGDPDDIQGWNATDQRWELMPSAMQTSELTPCDRSGFGWSVFVERILLTKCPPGMAVVTLLQYESKQHACTPTWSEGIVVSARVDDLLAHCFGVGESPSDCNCAPIKNAHASVWKAKGWSKVLRKKMLEKMGADAAVVFEDAERRAEKLISQKP